MTFTGKLTNLLYTAGGKQHISIEVNEKKDITHLRDCLLDIDIKKHREKRSLDANAYCWTLCQKIAEAIGNTKETVYQMMIREVGQFEIVPIKDNEVNKFIEMWSKIGYGWFAEKMEPSKLTGYTKVIRFYGSSVYDSKQMSVLLDEIISECKNLEIETEPEAEIKSMMEAWK